MVRLTPDMELPPLFAALVSVLDSGLIIVNTDNIVCYINPPAEEILDIRSRTAQGQGLIALVRDYQVDALVREVLHDTELRETTIQLISSSRTLRLRCMPLNLDDMGAVPPASVTRDDIDGVLLLIRDMTQISRLERARRDLVANVSHELRTPLASLKLLVETLQSEPPLKIARRMMSQMAQEIDAVTKLAEELHELSQLESGRVIMQFSPGDLERVLNEALSRIRPQADMKQIKIIANIADQNLPVLIDEHRVSQVLLNLLHNAVKFTAEGGEITVETRGVMVDDRTLKADYVDPDLFDTRMLAGVGMVDRHRNHPPVSADISSKEEVVFPTSHPPGFWMLISIRDTGIGIPIQDLPRIFERFYKVDRSRTRETGGTGLGLAIAKHLIEGHGGRLWADSEEGQGSIFYLTLPIA